MSLLEESFEVDAGPSRIPAAAPAPVPTYLLRRDVGGVDTELVLQTFDDRVVVVVTQSGKVGCLTQATLPQVHPLLPPPSEASAGGKLAALPPPPAQVSLTPLLGSPPNAPMHDLYVSQIATLVWWALRLANAPRRPVIVGLALKRLGTETDGLSDAERERFAAIMDMVASWPGP